MSISDNLNSFLSIARLFDKQRQFHENITFHINTLLEYDVTRRDHVSVVMDVGSRIVNFIVNFIRDGTVFA